MLAREWRSRVRLIESSTWRLSVRFGTLQRRLSRPQPTSVEGRDNSYMDFSEETTAHFNEVARSMLSMGKGAPQRVTGA